MERLQETDFVEIADGPQGTVRWAPNDVYV
jgi:hypothetical protein